MLQREREEVMRLKDEIKLQMDNMQVWLDQMVKYMSQSCTPAMQVVVWQFASFREQYILLYDLCIFNCLLAAVDFIMNRGYYFNQLVQLFTFLKCIQISANLKVIENFHRVRHFETTFSSVFSYIYFEQVFTFSQ